MAVEALPDPSGDEDPPLMGAFQPGWYLGPDTGCPPEFADVPVSELFAHIDQTRRQRAAAAASESLAAGFRPRPSLVSSKPGSGVECGGALDTSPPGGLLAGKRVESCACATALAVVSELPRRRPAPGTPAAAPGTFPEQLSEFISDE